MNEPGSAAYMVEILKMQLNDAHELTKKAQRRARHLQDELNKEIARRAHLEREIARLHAEIAGGLKSQPGAQPTTDNRS
jgi:predicted  nucleic acid-binding Zn-ribbon protein